MCKVIQLDLVSKSVSCPYEYEYVPVKDVFHEEQSYIRRKGNRRYATVIKTGERYVVIRYKATPLNLPKEYGEFLFELA